MTERLQNINVASSELLPTPEQVKRDMPLPQSAEEFVFRSRSALRRILDREDPRLFVVVGPCSIHDPVAAREYATRLHGLAQRVQDTMLVLMRVYFEKPRTTIGWKGLINDPDMDDSFHIEKGIRLARESAAVPGDIGLPAATEALDPIMPQYLSEL
jgi:3-deoxy-7-phosphoheptulonate synthase